MNNVETYIHICSRKGMLGVTNCCWKDDHIQGDKGFKVKSLKEVSKRRNAKKKKYQVWNGLKKLLIPVRLVSKQFVHPSKGIRREETYLEDLQENVQDIPIKTFFPADTFLSSRHLVKLPACNLHQCLLLLPLLARGCVSLANTCPLVDFAHRILLTIKQK